MAGWGQQKNAGETEFQGANLAFDKLCDLGR